MSRLETVCQPVFFYKVIQAEVLRLLASAHNFLLQENCMQPIPLTIIILLIIRRIFDKKEIVLRFYEIINDKEFIL